MKKWYIIYTFSGQEFKVKNILKKEIIKKKMYNLFGKILIPTENVIEMCSGKKKKSERKFFPGYILIEMILNNNTWYIIQNISKVFGFVGEKPGYPTSISRIEVNYIIDKIKESLKKPKPKKLFKIGEIIRVNDGPFSDLNGRVEEINYDKNRLCVGISIFGRSTPIDLDFSQVEKN